MRAYIRMKAYSIKSNYLELFNDLKNSIDEDQNTLYDSNNLENQIRKYE